MKTNDEKKMRKTSSAVYNAIRRVAKDWVGDDPRAMLMGLHSGLAGVMAACLFGARQAGADEVAMRWYLTYIDQLHDELMEELAAAVDKLLSVEPAEVAKLNRTVRE